MPPPVLVSRNRRAYAHAARRRVQTNDHSGAFWPDEEVEAAVDTNVVRRCVARGTRHEARIRVSISATMAAATVGARCLRRDSALSAVIGQPENPWRSSICDGYGRPGRRTERRSRTQYRFSRMRMRLWLVFFIAYRRRSRNTAAIAVRSRVDRSVNRLRCPTAPRLQR